MALLLPSFLGLLFATLLSSSLSFSQSLPDLTPEVYDIHPDLHTVVSPGDVQEGCASATSGVDLLRFSVLTRNVGTADLVLGDPGCPDCLTHPGEVCGNPLFHCSPAGGHNHGHYTNYARYELLDDANAVVATSGKFGFCLTDSSCSGWASPRYTCGDQGITVGCADIYASYLGCQYIDITNLADGNYTLRITADPFNKIVELDELNNTTIAPVTLNRSVDSDEELTGKSVELFTDLKSGRPRFKFRTPPATVLSLPTADLAPTSVGATLIIRDTAAIGGGISTIPLPANQWVGLGSPRGTKGYRYAGNISRGDECASISLKPNGLTILCQNLLPAPTLPIQGELKVQLRIGNGEKRYCATFGGLEVKNTTTNFHRKNAAPVPCD